MEKKTKENEDIGNHHNTKCHRMIEEVLVANSNTIYREIVVITSKNAGPMVDTVKDCSEDDVKY